MNASLFIPCYIDQLYPHVGIAMANLLENLGINVDYPEAQTCCGQPMANSGCSADAVPAARHFVETFKDKEYIVCPSGSCVSMVRNHYEDLVGDHPDYAAVKSRTYELCEFLSDVVKVNSLDVSFPHKVGLHQSCHGLRELRLGRSSELVAPGFSKVRRLLEMVQGIELVELTRQDECCGFGGTFSVDEEAMACAMGRDRIKDHQHAGAEVITGTDMSCLMHLDGLMRRDGSTLRVLHIAQILAGEAKL
jgi:L-lactate dehydrogenase complex protein LldE